MQVKNRTEMYKVCNKRY